MSAAIAWPIGLTILLAYGAYSDITARRLPNWLSLLLLITGFAYALITTDVGTTVWHAAHVAIALVIGMALFATGKFGGGDAKFYTGMAAWFALGNALTVLLWVSISAIVLILGWIVIRRMTARKRAAPEGDFAKFPYGVAIAVGAAIAIWLPFFAPPPGLA